MIVNQHLIKLYIHPGAKCWNLRLLPSNPANAVSAVLFGGVLGSLLGPGALAQVEQWDMLGKYS